MGSERLGHAWLLFALALAPALVGACSSKSSGDASPDAAADSPATVDAPSDAPSDAPESTDTAPPLCPADLPQSCPSPIPSYKKDVAPILAVHCTLCHSPTGIAAKPNLTSYALVSAQASPILDQVYMCRMPPVGYPPLATADRLTLLGWLVCNAPDN